MLLSEVSTKKSLRGTYAGVRFDKETKDVILSFIKKHKIPNPVPVEKLHSTILYSRKHLPKYKPKGELKNPLEGTPLELVVWKTSPKNEGDPQANCLVLKYSCKELEKRHKYLMDKHDAEYDYDEYIPHVTLSYDIGEMDIKKLQKLDLDKEIPTINAVHEYMEELDLDWAKNKGVK